MRLPLVAVTVVLAISPHARAGGAMPEDRGADYRPAPVNRDIVITSQGVRSNQTIALLVGIVGVAVIAGGIGLYENIDAKSASDAVSSSVPTGQTWTATQQANFDRANSSTTKAEVFYTIGGVALVGAIVGLILTDPKEETTVIHPHRTGPTPTVAPAPGGGAMLGGTWSF